MKLDFLRFALFYNSERLPRHLGRGSWQLPRLKCGCSRHLWVSDIGSCVDVYPPEQLRVLLSWQVAATDVKVQATLDRARRSSLLYASLNPACFVDRVASLWEARVLEESLAPSAVLSPVKTKAVCSCWTGL